MRSENFKKPSLARSGLDAWLAYTSCSLDRAFCLLKWMQNHLGPIALRIPSCDSFKVAFSKRVSIGWSASGNSKERPVIFS